MNPSADWNGSIEADGEANAPVKVGTVFNPTRLGTPPLVPCLLLLDPPALELASLRTSPRVLVLPAGSTNSIEVPGGFTLLMLRLGIRTYLGVGVSSEAVCPKLDVEIPSSVAMNIAINSSRARCIVSLPFVPGEW